MKDRFIPFVAAICCVTLALLPAPPFVANGGDAASQESQKRSDDEPIKLNTTLVQIPATVSQRDGRFITDLAQKDFAVFEDGKRQQIELFTTVKQPFTVVLVLDTSNSARDRLEVIQRMALAFAREVRPEDRLMVISFDNEIRRLTDFTADYQEIETAINQTESGFGKLLYEAVSDALDQLKTVEGRRAVILFSDGVDMKSIEADAASTLQKAEEIGAVIYAVKFETRWWQEAEARKQKAQERQSNLPFEVDGRIPLPPEFGGPGTDPQGKPKVRIEIGAPRPPDVTIIDGTTRRSTQLSVPDDLTRYLDKLYGEANASLQSLTSRTGGRVFVAETFDTTRSAFAAIAEELRNQYLLGYYSAGAGQDGKYHKLKVEVARKDAQVRARQGYRNLSASPAEK